MKKISVIIPLYNVAQYIEKCIESVNNQDLDEDDFEIIIIDDESPDNSREIAEEFTRNCPNVTIVSQKNKGLGGARNTGIKLAKGSYIVFLDSDDWYLPDTIKVVLQIALQNDLDILEFAAEGITPSGKIAYRKSASTSDVLNGMKYYNSVRYLNSACNKLYKSEFLKTNNLFFLERIFIEDFEFNTRAFAVANRVMATNFLVAQFLQSPNSITRNADNSKKKKMQEDIFFVLQTTKEISQQTIFFNNNEANHYFNERMGFIVATLFYQLFKNKASFQEMCKLKQLLVDKKLYCINYRIFESNKNWFRIIMLRNFWLFKVSQTIFR